MHKHKLHAKEKIIELFFGFCGMLSLLVTLGIITIIFKETFLFFREVSFFEFMFTTRWTPLFSTKHFGVLPLITGTLLVAGIAMTIAMPAGIIIAIFMNEYAPAKVRRILKPALEILAGIPTIVYGYFALLSVTPFLQKIIPSLSGFNAISPGIVMGIMILPMVVSLSDDAFAAVPKEMKLGAYALGSSRFQVAFTILLPAAVSGIIAAFILAMSRAIGETMLVAIA
ncbi:MAG TPA: phosphate ABC transporter permease subunit PstC, partial [Negativicutes bacterium]|nr:phosphate ABC transporter permease subunit PstC [Negativicutes bacterium]